MNRTDSEHSTVLIVEDTPESLDVLVESLEQAGFRLLVAQSGDEAFERVAVVRPDIILLDVMMPGMSGFKVCEKLKTDEDTRDIPILFITALSDTSEKVRGFELGAADYVTKPFQIEEVLARIKTHLSIRKLQQELNEALVRRSKRQMEDLRRNITTSMPHEVYTPLNTIFGFSNAIVENHEQMSKEKIVEYVRGIFESAEFLKETIRKYTLYAQIEIMASNPEKVKKCQAERMPDPRVQIEHIAKENARRTGRTSDLFLAFADAPAFEIPISERYFYNMTRELIENAFKFSEPGTPVHIRTSVKEDRFELHIGDKGRGMTAEQIANVGAYMQFGRKEYEQQGIGLGLMISKRLADIHNAGLRVESEGKDLGVRYVLELPAYPEDGDDEQILAELTRLHRHT